MSGIGSHHSSKMGKDEWLTPPNIIKTLGPFDLDPCAPVERPWDTAKRHFTMHDNGLLKPWHGRVWCNPPYGAETGKWLGRCTEHANALALIFARTETEDWRTHVWNAAHSILFIYGRLYFHHVTGKKASANSGAPSAIISYNIENTSRLADSGIEGKLVIL